MDVSGDEKPRLGKKPTTTAKRRRPEGDAERPETVPVPACSSNTLELTSHGLKEQEENSVAEMQNQSLGSLLSAAVFGLDWLESRGVVDYHIGKSRRAFDRLEETRKAAETEKAPVPVLLAGRNVYVSPRGMGTGRQARLEYKLDWTGITLGISPRIKAHRQLNNFYLKVPGEACLVMGWQEARDAATAIVEELGGRVIDEWFSLFDFCLDIPHLCVRDELLPCFEREHFLTTMSSWNPWGGKGGKTGFTVCAGARRQVKVYDKVREVHSQKTAVYRQAMIEHRWGGKEPEAATRVEYRVDRDWLQNLGLKPSTMCSRICPRLSLVRFRPDLGRCSC